MYRYVDRLQGIYSDILLLQRKWLYIKIQNFEILIFQEIFSIILQLQIVHLKVESPNTGSTSGDLKQE